MSISGLSSALATADAAQPVGGLAGWAVQVMDTLGGVGAALLVGLDNVFPPIPSELILPLAGFAASQGSLTLAGALIWTTVGSVVGAIIVYLVGAALGRDRTRALMVRVPLLKASDFDKSEQWFAKHGTKAVFLGRMVPLFRSVISLPAGIERMRWWVFLGLTALGSLIWNSIFVVTGYLLGENWYLVQQYSSIGKKIIIVALAVAIGWFIFSRLRNRRDRHRDDDATATRAP